MADGNLTPCNVARSLHWFRQVTAPCNVVCGSGIVTVNSPRGSTLQCDAWLWDGMLLNSPCNVTHGSGIMTLNSPSGSTLQCDTWVWGWHAVEFTRWHNPTMWHIALGSWHWICQVAAPCNVAGGSGMTCHGICPNVRHIGILHLISILTISPQSTCHSAPVWKFYPNRTCDLVVAGSRPGRDAAA